MSTPNGQASGYVFTSFLLLPSWSHCSLSLVVDSRAREYSEAGAGRHNNNTNNHNNNNNMAVSPGGINLNAANAAERATLGMGSGHPERSERPHHGGGGGGGGGGGRRRPPAYDCDDHSWCCQASPPREQRPSPQASPVGGVPQPPSTPPQAIEDGVQLWPGVSKLRPNKYGLLGAAGAHIGSRQSMEDRHR
jgi:hypothetical protein